MQISVQRVQILVLPIFCFVLQNSVFWKMSFLSYGSKHFSGVFKVPWVVQEILVSEILPPPIHLPSLKYICHFLNILTSILLFFKHQTFSSNFFSLLFLSLPIKKQTVQFKKINRNVSPEFFLKINMIKRC